ncbi:MAG: sigma-70 family RNA polymerase sigma factor [Ruminococcus sp.]|nr:sigma-70 family RNA polymerase sigma factor [Ruminococcus sp.]
MKKPIEKYISEYSLALTKLCISLTDRREDAEDLFQTTWEKAIRNIRRYDAEKPFEKWLFAICVNTYRDKVRRYERGKIWKFPSAEEQEKVIISIPSEEKDADTSIVLKDAVKKLTPPLREAIVLYYYRGYSVLELAELLNIPEGTVKSRLSTARKQLRKELSEYE